MGYIQAPWIFKGRALFQLQWVKTDEARKYIPPELKLVNFFGYTLGGFYLARYADSPAGSFDEMVVLGGLVWNFPTSCAWAARVYVNEREARNHGLKVVGLPSRQGAFQEDPAVNGRHRRSWWRQPHQNLQGEASTSGGGEEGDHPLLLHNVEGGGWWRRPAGGSRALSHPVCRLHLPPARSGWPGPRLTIPLPSFSGATPDFPNLVQYACMLRTNVRTVKPAKVDTFGDDSSNASEVVSSVLSGRPLVAFAFDNMEMTVSEPVRIAQKPHPHPQPAMQLAVA